MRSEPVRGNDPTYNGSFMKSNNQMNTYKVTPIYLHGAAVSTEERRYVIQRIRRFRQTAARFTPLPDELKSEVNEIEELEDTIKSLRGKPYEPFDLPIYLHKLNLRYVSFVRLFNRGIT